MKDFYEILGVSPKSETEVITAAYKAMMRKYHPDTNKSASAADKAQEINEAYEVLKSPLKRREYDAERAHGSAPSPPPPPPPPPPPTPPRPNEFRSEKVSKSKGGYFPSRIVPWVVAFLLIPAGVFMAFGDQRSEVTTAVRKYLNAAGQGWLWNDNQGFTLKTLVGGEGPMPGAGDVVLVNYVGRLSNGKEFDSGEKVAIPVDGVIAAFGKGLQEMQRGGKYRLIIPAAHGYGAQGKKSRSTGKAAIPANSDLYFDVEMIDFRDRAEIEDKRRALGKMQP